MRIDRLTIGKAALIVALTASIHGCNDSDTVGGPSEPPTTATPVTSPGNTAVTPPGDTSGANVGALPTAAVGSNQLDGLYMTVYSSGGGTIKTYYLFTPAGDFTTIPFGGIDRFDFAAAAKAYPDSTGNYTLDGNKLTLRFANGTTRDMKYEVTKDGVELDGLYAYKAPPYQPGTTLEGKYSGSEAASGGGDRASSARTYVFRKDGTYELAKLGAVVANSPAVEGNDPNLPVEGSAGSGSNESGTYTLSGNTLELKSSDGKATKMTIFPYEDYDNTIELNIDGMFCKPIP